MVKIDKSDWRFDDIMKIVPGLCIPSLCSLLGGWFYIYENTEGRCVKWIGIMTFYLNFIKISSVYSGYLRSCIRIQNFNSIAVLDLHWFGFNSLK